MDSTGFFCLFLKSKMQPGVGRRSLPCSPKTAPFPWAQFSFIISLNFLVLLKHFVLYTHRCRARWVSFVLPVIFPSINFSSCCCFFLFFYFILLGFLKSFHISASSSMSVPLLLLLTGRLFLKSGFVLSSWWEVASFSFIPFSPSPVRSSPFRFFTSLCAVSKAFYFPYHPDGRTLLRDRLTCSCPFLEKVFS